MTIRLTTQVQALGVLLLLAGVMVGLAVPASAQQVVRLYGTLVGTTGTPVPLAADGNGYLQVVCTNLP